MYILRRPKQNGLHWSKISPAAALHRVGPKQVAKLTQKKGIARDAEKKRMGATNSYSPSRLAASPSPKKREKLKKENQSASQHTKKKLAICLTPPSPLHRLLPGRAAGSGPGALPCSKSPAERPESHVQRSLAPHAAQFTSKRSQRAARGFAFRVRSPFGW